MLTRRLTTVAHVDAAAPLTFDQRTRSRQRIRLDDGREVGIMLPRGETLRDGDLLASNQGLVVRVRAAPESVSSAVSTEQLLLARACYHLGNRHVALQIELGRLRWLHDHVLDGMVRGLGLVVTSEHAPFEPEQGAYRGPTIGQGHRHHDH
ncbi:MAG: urease accessory protein UreE [Thiohalocapsa sp.]